jgi:hypothetical protein
MKGRLRREELCCWWFGSALARGDGRVARGFGAMLGSGMGNRALRALVAGACGSARSFEARVRDRAGGVARSSTASVAVA